MRPPSQEENSIQAVTVLEQFCVGTTGRFPAFRRDKAGRSAAKLFPFEAINRFSVCGQFLPLPRKFQILIFYIQMRGILGCVHALLDLPSIIFHTSGHRPIALCGNGTMDFVRRCGEILEFQQ